MSKIHKNDQVVVLTGKDRGKKGRVMKVYAGEGRALVEKINYYKKALRKSKENPQGGLASMEGSISLANIQLVCPRCNKPTRVGISILTDGTKQRICKKCHEIIGA